MKKIIGKWDGNNVNLHKEGKKVYWTITGKDGTEHNRFNDPESFGHWVYHSGWNANK